MTRGNVFAFLPGKRRVIDQEVHGNGRLGDLLERNGRGVFRIADGIADVNVRNTGDRNDGTHGCFRDIDLV